MIAKNRRFCYNIDVMEKKTHFYVSLKNGMTWLVVLCMVCSAVARVFFVGMKGTDHLWCQIVLPIAAAQRKEFCAFGEAALSHFSF